MLPALCSGLGIAILPDFIVRPHLEAGRLETILEAWLPPPMSLHLLTPPGDPRPVRVELLAEFLAGRFRAICSGPVARTSTRLTSIPNAHLVCRSSLENKH